MSAVRILSTVAVGAVAAIATVLPGAPAKAADEVVLGLSFGRTGLYSTINKTTEVAVDIAVAEINAAGGIGGKKIRMVKFDTAGDPKQAVVAVRKFARDDNALAVIGPFSSSEAQVAFAAGEREGIVQIPNASSAPKLADPFSYAFRVTESEYLQFIRVTSTMKKRNALSKSVAIMYGTDDVVSKAVGLQIMQPIFEKEGVKITGPIGFASKAFDVSAQVSELKGKQIDYVGVAGVTQIPIRELPDIDSAVVTVSTDYTGAAPEIIGAQLTTSGTDLLLEVACPTVTQGAVPYTATADELWLFDPSEPNLKVYLRQ